MMPENHIDLIRSIARGEEVGITGRMRRITRTEMMTRCREICDGLGLSYSKLDLTPTRTDRTSGTGEVRTTILSTVTRKRHVRSRADRASDLAGMQSGSPGSRQAKTES